MSKLQFVLIAALLLVAASAKTAQEWKTRNIYQIITDRFALGDGSKPYCDLNKQPYYCGGNFKGIENNLDYIQGMGFNAIWISPVPDNYPNQFHGYAAKNMTEINSHFGGADGLKSLIDACHKRDIWVMIDVVANHMGNTDQNYSQNVPFNSPDHYHSYCIISDSDFATKNMYNIQHCRLAGLADLNQENSYVSDYLVNWIKDLVQTYNVDGIRIDTVPEVHPDFWKQYTNSAGVFATGEVFDGDFGYVASYIPSVGSVLNYPWYFNMRDIFVNQKDMWGVRTYYQNWAQQNADLSILTPFVDNHDNPRFLSDQVFTNGKDRNTRIQLLKGYTTFTLTSIGIPILYYGTEQYFSGNTDPYDREPIWNNLDTNSEMYKYVQSILHAKTITNAGLQGQTEAYCDQDLYAFFRGKLFVGVTSKFNQVTRQIVTHPFSNGEVICNIFYPTQDCLTITNNSFNLVLIGGEAKIFVPKSLLSKSTQFLR
ncbi:hypothetical protein ABPG74_014883 [Tetrahymena malaccensis]